MGNDEMEKKDPGLQGNEKMEAAIAGLQQEPTQEMLAHTLTVIRRRMKENGQLIIAVEPPKGDGQIQLQAIQTEDGKKWWAAFTGFEEELKGGGSVKSTFMTDIRKLFESALQVEEIEGIIINPSFRIYCIFQIFNGKSYGTVIISGCRIDRIEPFQALIKIDLDPFFHTKRTDSARSMSDDLFYLFKWNHFCFDMKGILVFPIVNPRCSFCQNQYRLLSLEK